MNSQQRLILVDAHVHLRDCFDVDLFLDEAYANFEEVAWTVDQSTKFIGVLLFTDSDQEGGFERLLDYLERNGSSDAVDGEAWHLRSTPDNTSVYLERGQAESAVLFVTAGRQLVSEEQLEVLALGTQAEFKEGIPARQLVRAVAEAEALPVIPWGVGKWIGRRGTIVKDLLRDPTLPRFFVGDSANRPFFWPQSPLFQLAEERGIRNLPGSDPLPLPAECQRPGGFGSVLCGSLDSKQPTQDLLKKLADPSTELRYYGQGDGPLAFLRNQVAMQYRKRLK
jgi:hypothetical protein